MNGTELSGDATLQRGPAANVRLEPGDPRGEEWMAQPPTSGWSVVIPGGWGMSPRWKQLLLHQAFTGNYKMLKSIKDSELGHSRARS